MAKEFKYRQILRNSRGTFVKWMLYETEITIVDGEEVPIRVPIEGLREMVLPPNTTDKDIYKAVKAEAKKYGKLIDKQENDEGIQR